MNTLDYLRETHQYLWEEGDALMDNALHRKPYDAVAQDIFKAGLTTVRFASSLWPLIHWYRSFETSYWALRRLGKPAYDEKDDPRYCWSCGEIYMTAVHDSSD